MFIKKIEMENRSDIEFLEKLYIESFPTNERRSLYKMLHLIETEDRFDVFLVFNNQNQRVGFYTQWDFEAFLFLEHFAISADFRNGGYGKLVMEDMLGSLTKPLIGEIEPSTLSEMAKRRRFFYERLGFKVWINDYKQPPYDEDTAYIPMYLISYGDIDLNKNFREVRDLIYTQVYKVVD